MVVGGQYNVVQGERGEVRQQDRGTVGGPTLRGSLGSGLAPGASGDSGRFSPGSFGRC